MSPSGLVARVRTGDGRGDLVEDGVTNLAKKSHDYIACDLLSLRVVCSPSRLRRGGLRVDARSCRSGPRAVNCTLARLGFLRAMMAQHTNLRAPTIGSPY